MGIEEMFRDYKSGGYYLEGKALKGQRLMVLILLIALVYTSASVQRWWLNLRLLAIDLRKSRRWRWSSQVAAANNSYQHHSDRPPPINLPHCCCSQLACLSAFLQAYNVMPQILLTHHSYFYLFRLEKYVKSTAIQKKSIGPHSNATLF
jgi:hypothetical protein